MKGVSPLIASVLLIAFTVAVATLIMGWMSTYSRTVTSNVSEETATAIDCSKAAINIEHVYVGSASHASNATVVVKNTGFEDLSIKGLIVDTDGSSCDNTTGTTLSTGSVVNLGFWSSDCPKKSEVAYVMVTTDCAGVYDKTDNPADITETTSQPTP